MKNKFFEVGGGQFIRAGKYTLDLNIHVMDMDYWQACLCKNWKVAS